MREVGDVGLVGYEDDGVALGVELVEQAHNLYRSFGVEVSGGLVGEDDAGLVDEGAGNGDTLALPARELVGLVVHAARRDCQTLGDGLLGALDALCAEGVPLYISGSSTLCRGRWRGRAG